MDLAFPNGFVFEAQDMKGSMLYRPKTRVPNWARIFEFGLQPATNE